MEWLEYCKTFIGPLETEFKARMGFSLNLSNPRRFTEKMQWLKIYDSTFLKTYCTDKITIHNFCERLVGKDLCIPLIRTVKTPDEIHYNELPKQCVIKCNHGCKMNIILKNNIHSDWAHYTKLLSSWLKKDFSTAYGYELHYKLIPHKILIEQYMNDGHADLVDYKFYCFNGNPVFCQVIQDRHQNMTVSHFTNAWTYAPKYDWVEYYSDARIAPPSQYDEMLRLSKILAKPFKMVRCDFYEIGGKVYLGELTFTPNSGFHKFKCKNTDYELGELLQL